MAEVAVEPKRRGFKRWIILALVVLGFYAAFIGPGVLRPISPIVVLPGEPTGLSIAGFEITNTTLATLLTDLIILLIAFSAYRYYTRGNLVPKGFLNFFEMIIEFLWNSEESAMGAKWARRTFPFLATFFLLILTANVIKLFPGFESIGRLAEVHKPGATGYEPVRLFSIGGIEAYGMDKTKPHVAAAHAEGEEEAASEAESGLCTACEVVPFLRGAATDLNFPLALAFISVLMTQVFGVWSLGASYFEKYFQVRALISGGPFGAINFGVGFLELILEFAKVLSFSFRLFGNIFAGTLLLSIVGALTAVIVPTGLYFLELFFGSIQAYVFFLLSLAFMGAALVSHGGNHSEEHA